MADELWRCGAVELAAKIRAREVSSIAVVQAHLDRIAAVNSRVNAVTVVLDEEAVVAARAADAVLSSGADVGPLHGVPMTVKENIDLAGSATTQAVVGLKDAVAPTDTPHIAQMKAAGAIPIGRTNLPDFGMRWHTDNALHGATKNPWDASRSPGGSSGGDAAALATGMTPLGMGNDYGGSLRLPSYACGTCAIRPSLGRVAYMPQLEPYDFPITLQLFAVQGPMARRVEDLRAALAAMSNHDARDPWWTPAPLEGPRPSGKVRVAVTTSPAGYAVDPDVARGTADAAAALKDAGYETIEVDPPAVAEGATLWAQLVMTDLAAGFLPVMQELAAPEAISFLETAMAVAEPLDLAGYVAGLAARNGIARSWSQFFEEYPLVLGPVSTQKTFPVGFDLGGVDNVRQATEAFSLMTLVNMLGLPAVALPVGVAGGLPLGVQVIGNRYREDLCLEAAQAIEERLGILTPIDPR
jgi:amidase